MKRDSDLFQNTIGGYGFNGCVITEQGWTSPHRRYYFAKTKRDGTETYVKMTHPRWVDLDDRLIYDGMWRTHWFTDVINAVRGLDANFPFSVPRIISHNLLKQALYHPAVAYVEFRHNSLGPICRKLPEIGMNSPEFIELCKTMAECHHAMQRITPAYLREMGYEPLLPDFLPHEMLGFHNKVLVELLRRVSFCSTLWHLLLSRHENRARRRVLMNPDKYVLDTGAFESKNFFRSDNDLAEIIDTEFAGWTRPHAALAKAYVRLWTNEQRPDLACFLLYTYYDMFVWGHSDAIIDAFFESFCRELLIRIRSDNFSDIFRQRRLRRDSPGHVLRRELRRIVLSKNYNSLMS